MSMSHQQLRTIIKKFWEESPRNHKEVPPAPLVLKEDSTSLFTSSGMQQFIYNLQGEQHAMGKRIYDIQPCIRTQDIEEVGDNQHDTFFEMIGNWSFGDYFKQEQLPWVWELFTKRIFSEKNIKDKLYVTVFEGNKNVPKDEESAAIWKKLGIADDHIFYYGAEKNWWSRSGTPEKMPVGEIGGPDSEVFYDFGTPHDKKFGPECHPNCDCGRFMEIGNSVFIQYKKASDGTLQELPQKNVDYGGGIERILAAANNNPDIFKTDIFKPVIEAFQDYTGIEYGSSVEIDRHIRVMVDHIKISTFLLAQGVLPSSKEHGYVLRRLIRRAVAKMLLVTSVSKIELSKKLVLKVIEIYKNIYFKDIRSDIINKELGFEIDKFDRVLSSASKLIRKASISGQFLFDLQQSSGVPLEIALEMIQAEGKIVTQDMLDDFHRYNQIHKNQSRTASAGMFKGGLADHSEQVLKYHTATHLIHQALFDVMGEDIRQEGSNITGERLRFDFYSSYKPQQKEINDVVKIVNNKIKESLPMQFKIMPREEAFKVGARSFFKEKYPEQVKVYYIGGEDDKPETAYSKEFCGGPHVKNTSEIGKIEIYKFEKIGSNLYRIYAK